MKKSTVTKYENGANAELEFNGESYKLWTPEQLQVRDLQDLHKFLTEVLSDLGVQLPNAPVVLTDQQKQLQEKAPMKNQFAIDA